MKKTLYALIVATVSTGVLGGCMFDIEEPLDLGHYTMEARRVMSHAAQSTQAARGDKITPEHLVLGLLQPDVRASEFIRASGAELGTLQTRIKALIPPREGKAPSTFAMDERTKAILRAAYNEPKTNGRKMTSVDILLGVLGAGGSPATQVLTQSGVTLNGIQGAFRADPERDKWTSE